MNEEEKSWLQALWEKANAPAFQLPEMQPPSGVDHPHARVGRTVLNTAGDLIEGFASPVGAISTLLSGGSSLAGRAGLLGISRGARALEAALSLPAVAQGAQQIATADSPGEALAGTLQTALGATGISGARTHSFPPKKVSEAYKRAKGMPLDEPSFATNWDEDLAKRTADAYDAMRHAPNDPQVSAAYGALADEVSEQFKFLRDRAGVRMEPHVGAGQPYASSAEMLDDIKRNNRLRYFPTEQGYGQPSPFGARPDTAMHATPSVAGPEFQMVEPANPMLRPGRSGLPVNDEFRAVHDYFGHGQRGFQFGPRGERNAYVEHSTMFSPQARKALTTETHGQNSWVNAGRHLRRADGSLPVKGDPDFVPVTSRPYADQKTGLLPNEFVIDPMQEVLLQALMKRR